MGLLPIFNLLCNHPKGVTCEIPRTLLVLSSSLAKATASRFLGVISSVYSLTGSEVQPTRVLRYTRNIYCPTDSMIADMFTKPLTRPKLQKFVEMVGLI